MGLLERKVAGMLEERITDSKRGTEAAVKQALEQVKQNYEEELARIHSHFQDAVSRVKQDSQVTVGAGKRELEERTFMFKTDVDNMVKSFRMQQGDELVAFRDEVVQKVAESELRAHRQFAKLLDETTQVIEDSINHNLVGQMKELDMVLKDMTLRQN